MKNRKCEIIDDKVEVFFKQKKYNISKYLIDRLNKLNINIDDEYFDYIVEYRNPFLDDMTESHLFKLLNHDYYNRILYDKEKGLGNILIYDKIGNIIGEYSSLTEMLLEVNQQGLLYGFRNLHNKGIVPEKRKIEFYGVEITYVEQHPYLTVLNNLTKEINGWRNGKTQEKIYNDKYRINVRKNYSFENFVLQRVKYTSFLLGELEMNKNRELSSKKNISGTEEDYKLQLNILFDRYTLGDLCGFEEVKDLKSIHKYSGIYIMCFDNEKKYYIGQAKHSFKERIVQHFINPKSSFDDTHKPTDVSKIYVMHTTDEFIDLIEQDCIATISKEYLLNVLVGGNSIDSIRSNHYNPKEYMLSFEFIESVIEDINNAKKINKKNIGWYNYFKEGKEIIGKIKILKDEKITEEMCKKAINFDGNSLLYIPKKFKTPELCLEALSYGGDIEIIFRSIPPEYLSEDFIIELISINRRITKQLPKELKTRKVMEAAGYKYKK